MIRLFQAMGFGAHYLDDFNSHYPNVGSSFEARKKALLNDRHGASHILKPVYEQNPDACFTVCDDAALQISWARGHGFESNDLEKILLAQIEEHRTEVFYSNDPIGFPSSFVKKLPGTVKVAIAWRAAPSSLIDLSAYSAILSNFELLNARWRAKGWSARRFYPSASPDEASYGKNSDRSTDVFFAGSYARTTGHENRLVLLNEIAGLNDNYQIDLRLLYRRWGRLSDRLPWHWIPVPIRLPRGLKSIVGPPIYGLRMNSALSKSKIVINPATDIAGTERGNMRCWEALSCGTCMLGSAGQYPEGFEPGVNFDTFTNTSDLIQKIESLLNDEPRRAAMAVAGSNMLAKTWSKERQWMDFEEIVSSI